MSQVSLGPQEEGVKGFVRDPTTAVNQAIELIKLASKTTSNPALVEDTLLNKSKYIINIFDCLSSANWDSALANAKFAFKTFDKGRVKTFGNTKVPVAKQELVREIANAATLALNGFGNQPGIIQLITTRDSIEDVLDFRARDLHGKKVSTALALRPSPAKLAASKPYIRDITKVSEKDFNRITDHSQEDELTVSSFDVVNTSPERDIRNYTRILSAFDKHLGGLEEEIWNYEDVGSGEYITLKNKLVSKLDDLLNPEKDNFVSLDKYEKMLASLQKDLNKLEKRKEKGVLKSFIKPKGGYDLTVFNKYLGAFEARLDTAKDELARCLCDDEPTAVLQEQVGNLVAIRNRLVEISRPYDSRIPGFVKVGVVTVGAVMLGAAMYYGANTLVDQDHGGLVEKVSEPHMKNMNVAKFNLTKSADSNYFADLNTWFEDIDNWSLVHVDPEYASLLHIDKYGKVNVTDWSEFIPGQHEITFMYDNGQISFNRTLLVDILNRAAYFDKTGESLQAHIDVLVEKDGKVIRLKDYCVSDLDRIKTVSVKVPGSLEGEKSIAGDNKTNVSLNDVSFTIPMNQSPFSDIPIQVSVVDAFNDSVDLETIYTNVPNADPKFDKSSFWVADNVSVESGIIPFKVLNWTDPDGFTEGGLEVVVSKYSGNTASPVLTKSIDLPNKEAGVNNNLSGEFSLNPSVLHKGWYAIEYFFKNKAGENTLLAHNDFFIKGIEPRLSGFEEPVITPPAWDFIGEDGKLVPYVHEFTMNLQNDLGDTSNIEIYVNGHLNESFATQQNQIKFKVNITEPGDHIIEVKSEDNDGKSKQSIYTKLNVTWENHVPVMEKPLEEFKPVKPLSVGGKTIIHLPQLRDNDTAFGSLAGNDTPIYTKAEFAGVQVPINHSRAGDYVEIIPENPGEQPLAVTAADKNGGVVVNGMMLDVKDAPTLDTLDGKFIRTNARGAESDEINVTFSAKAANGLNLKKASLEVYDYDNQLITTIDNLVPDNGHWKQDANFTVADLLTKANLEPGIYGLIAKVFDENEALTSNANLYFVAALGNATSDLGLANATTPALEALIDQDAETIKDLATKYSPLLQDALWRDNFETIIKTYITNNAKDNSAFAGKNETLAMVDAVSAFNYIKNKLGVYGFVDACLLYAIDKDGFLNPYVFLRTNGDHDSNWDGFYFTNLSEPDKLTEITNSGIKNIYVNATEGYDAALTNKILFSMLTTDEQNAVLSGSIPFPDLTKYPDRFKELIENTCNRFITNTTDTKDWVHGVKAAYCVDGKIISNKPLSFEQDGDKTIVRVKQ